MRLKEGNRGPECTEFCVLPTLATLRTICADQSYSTCMSSVLLCAQALFVSGRATGFSVAFPTQRTRQAAVGGL